MEAGTRVRIRQLLRADLQRVLALCRGLHMQQPDSTMFGSAMNYAAARLLGKVARNVVARYVWSCATSQAPTRTALK